MDGFDLTKLLVLMLCSVFLYSLYVKCFRRLSQTERKEGLESHQRKNGTITMGGILFLVLPLFFVPYTSDSKIILFTMLAFGVIGMIDDVLIILLKKNDGLSASVKLIIEIVISGIIFYFYLQANKSTMLTIGKWQIDLKWFFGIFILWLLTASSNAWNLMDGVDGLCAGCSLLIGIALMMIALERGQYDIFYLLAAFHLTLFVFWCFNLPKAFLFMGDVGSLALGSFYGICSIYLDCILPFILMSGLYIFETISVIVQVAYFKKTKGKRLFRMAPFHHHLEACGLKEVQIDILFYLIQIILIVFAFLLL